MSQEFKCMDILISFRYVIHESSLCRSTIMYNLKCTINGIARKMFYNVLMLIILTVYYKVLRVDF